MKIQILASLLMFLPLLSNASGVPTSFTYQGKALNAAGTSPLIITVSFTLSVTDPSGACILYQESQPGINLATTNGLFALQIGQSATTGGKRTASDPGLLMTQVFANAGTQLVPASGACTSGYTPAANDVRKLHVVITPTSGSPITISPDLTVNAVPNAMVAETLQGLTPANLTPSGSVITYAGATCPVGFLTTDGTSYLISQYPTLANSLKSGTTYLWGSADSNHFNVPDFRGVFIRGLDNMGTAAGNAGQDLDGASRVVGSYQADQVVSHNHSYQSQNQGARATYSVQPNGTGGVDVLNTVTGNYGGTETRSKNYAVMYCIKN